MGARDRHDAVGDGLIEPLLHALARIEVLGDDVETANITAWLEFRVLPGPPISLVNGLARQIVKAVSAFSEASPEWANRFGVLASCAGPVLGALV